MQQELNKIIYCIYILLKYFSIMKTYQQIKCIELLKNNKQKLCPINYGGHLQLIIYFLYTSLLEIYVVKNLKQSLTIKILILVDNHATFRC